jgi:uncharacterized protein
MKHHILHGAGLTLRPALWASLKNKSPENLQFLELMPSDWVGVGSKPNQDLVELTQRFPSVCVSQSLSLGGPGILDKQVLRDLRSFMETHDIQVFSEALAWSADDAPLFINLPIPSTQAAVKWTASRIAQVQEALGLEIGIRNVVHHMRTPWVEMNEAEFISAVVKASGCRLHLDLPALAANGLRFNFDPHAFLQALPLASIDYVRVGQESALLYDVKQLNLEAMTC